MRIGRSYRKRHFLAHVPASNSRQSSSPKPKPYTPNANNRSAGTLSSTNLKAKEAERLARFSCCCGFTTEFVTSVNTSGVLDRHHHTSRCLHCCLRCWQSCVASHPPTPMPLRMRFRLARLIDRCLFGVTNVGCRFAAQAFALQPTLHPSGLEHRYRLGSPNRRI